MLVQLIFYSSFKFLNNDAEILKIILFGAFFVIGL